MLVLETLDSCRFVRLVGNAFPLFPRHPRVIMEMMFQTQNLHVKEVVRLMTPNGLKARLPATESSNRTVFTSRERVERILSGEDHRLLAVVGPCSIHDTVGALDYGQRLM